MNKYLQAQLTKGYLNIWINGSFVAPIICQFLGYFFLPIFHIKSANSCNAVSSSPSHCGLRFKSAISALYSFAEVPLVMYSLIDYALYILSIGRRLQIISDPLDPSVGNSRYRFYSSVFNPLRQKRNLHSLLPNPVSEHLPPSKFTPAYCCMPFFTIHQPHLHFCY